MSMLSSALIWALSGFPLLTTQSKIAEGDSSTYVLPTDIVVTASRMSVPLKRLPFSVGVVDSTTLHQMPRSVSLDEALKLVPGVKIDNQSDGNRIHVSMRGQGILTERGIRGIKVLYDGIPENDPTGFDPDLFDVDFSNVSSIEVLRGTAASLYGASASGGIVNVHSQNSPPNRLSGTVSLGGGSNGFWKEHGEFGGSTDKVNYRLFFSRNMADGYRVHSHSWGDKAYAKAIFMPSKSITLTPIFGWTSVYDENPEGLDLASFRLDPKLPNPDAVPFNEFLKTERVTGGLTGDISIKTNQTLQFVEFLKRTWYTDANNGTFTHRTFTTPGSSLQYSLATGGSGRSFKNTVSVGTDAEWQIVDERQADNLHSIEGDTTRTRERVKQRGLGLFLIDAVEIGAGWGAMASLRYDKIHNELEDQLRSSFDASGSADFEKGTGRLGVTYSPSAKTDLFLNWGQGFLPPATEELAQNPDNFGGFNKHLTSSSSSGTDLGVRGSLGKSCYYDLTGFYLRTKNDIDRYRLTDSVRGQEAFYRNFGSSRRLGLELYSRITPVRPLILQVAYTYSNFQYTMNDSSRVMMDDTSIVKYARKGNQLPNSPKHQLVVDARYEIGHSVVVGFTTESISRTYIDGANLESEAATGYTLLHARVEYDWRFLGVRGELSLQARNLGNRNYAAFTEPDPGGNSYQPGPGREVFAGLRIRL
jgi:iron complex outermembrane recepter protein